MRRRGFTMLEVLTVVVIIVILGGMLLAGSKYIINTSKTNTTRTMLANLKSMMTEREAAVGANKNNSDINAIFPTGVPVQPPLAAPGAVDIGMAARTPAAGNAVAFTQSVMSLLKSVTANNKIMAAIPTQQFLETTMAPAAPVLMDGFNYPIIAVPSTGMSGVMVNGSTVTIIAPDGKPFFASPGPDGDFSKGDDNVYSFQQ